MSAAIIRWSKHYHEDLGSQDESGYYDYVYRYFMYSFYSPSGSKIIIRQYQEEPKKGSIFVYSQGYEVGAVEAVAKEVRVISAVVAFVQASEKITQFDYFNSGYKPLDLTKLSNKRGKFSFIRVSDEE